MKAEHFVGRVSLRALILRDKKIFISRAKGDTLWQIPGGRLHLEEDPIAGMARELKEELGIDAVVGDIFHTEFFYHTNTGVPQVMLVFRCALKEGEEPQARDPQEVEEMRWISQGDLKTITLFPDCLHACEKAFASIDKSLN